MEKIWKSKSDNLGGDLEYGGIDGKVFLMVLISRYFGCNDLSERILRKVKGEY